MSFPYVTKFISEKINIQTTVYLVNNTANILTLCFIKKLIVREYAHTHTYIYIYIYIYIGLQSNGH